MLPPDLAMRWAAEPDEAWPTADDLVQLLARLDGQAGDVMHLVQAGRCTIQAAAQLLTEIDRTRAAVRRCLASLTETVH